MVVQQPTLAKYRVPVFRELAHRDRIGLKLVYGSRPDLPNVEPDGFAAATAPLHWYRIAGGSLFWHTPQWRYATRRTTDVLLLTWNVRYLSLLPALVRARAHHVPTILWGHGYSKQERAWRAKSRSQVARLATALLFYNRSAADRYGETVGNSPRIFVAPNCLDQQPIDAVAMVRAYQAAYSATGNATYLTRMRKAFDWFLGVNDSGESLYNFRTGGCADGLTRTGVNLNQGAESTLCFLLALLTLVEVFSEQERATRGTAAGRALAARL